jgi:hypothetical protein
MKRLWHLTGPSLAAATWLALVALPERALAGTPIPPATPELDSFVLFGAGAVVLGAFAWSRRGRRSKD